VLNIRIVQEAQNRLFEFFVLVNRHQFVIEFVAVVHCATVSNNHQPLASLKNRSTGRRIYSRGSKSSEARWL